jgi:hypothetical protein
MTALSRVLPGQLEIHPVDQLFPWCIKMFFSIGRAVRGKFSHSTPPPLHSRHNPIIPYYRIDCNPTFNIFGQKKVPGQEKVLPQNQIFNFMRRMSPGRQHMFTAILYMFSPLRRMFISGKHMFI